MRVRGIVEKKNRKCADQNPVVARLNISALSCLAQELLNLMVNMVSVGCLRVLGSKIVLRAGRLCRLHVRADASDLDLQLTWWNLNNWRLSAQTIQYRHNPAAASQPAVTQQTHWCSFKPMSGISIQEQLKGTTVLLTGGTGYVGSLVLEALLRTTAVGKVYVLLRAKGQQSPEDRLRKLLQVGCCC